MEHRSTPHEAAGPEPGAELETGQLETFLRHLPVGFVVVDASTRRVIRANDEAERLLGGAADDALGSNRYRGFDREGHEYGPHEWPISRTLEAGETVRNALIRLVFSDGLERVLSVTSSPVRTGDRMIAAVMVLEDVTDRELRARAERDFITNAAHELQTPLAAITSAVEVLEAGAKTHPAERDRFLDHIDQAAARLTRLTQGLLVLARVQTRREVPRLEVLQLKPLLRAIADGLQADDVSVECSSELGVLANRPLLEQAIGNLGENAVKHASGRVVLAGRRVDGRVAVDVRDQGPGIAADDTSNVFGRFVRGPTPVPGFGLGLAIVRETVDALEGELELETGVDGTRVSILLPGATVKEP